jgi:hypothetical protein
LKPLDRVFNGNEFDDAGEKFQRTTSSKSYFPPLEYIVIAGFLLLLSSTNPRNVIIHFRGISIEVEMNVLEDLTKELQNAKY